MLDLNFEFPSEGIVIGGRPPLHQHYLIPKFTCVDIKHCCCGAWRVLRKYKRTGGNSVVNQASGFTDAIWQVRQHDNKLYTQGSQHTFFFRA